MPKIFVSYARTTASQAKLIAETLRNSGHDVWMDDALLADRSFTDAIEEQLNLADAVLVAWSADAVRSEWVRAEANRARTAGKLVQVRLDPCDLPLPYDQIHCVDLSSWSGDFDIPQWRSVLASVAAVAGRGPRSSREAPSSNATPAADRRARTPKGGERRQITTLYCDLVDAADLSSRLDPEDVADIMATYHATCRGIITRNGGSVGGDAGRGILAYFGYPRGDEEEAANAVRAGLALCNAMSDLALPPDVVLRNRVGVATGLVVISELMAKGEGGSPNLVGESLNLAMRLESVAAPNRVAVAESTRRIVEGLFNFRDLGEVPLQGYDAPVRAFEALDATAVGTRSQARSQGETTPLVGRETELALLCECWDLVLQGEGQVVLVHGEAGIGKSRLVESFRGHTAESPHAQAIWYCAPNFSADALYPVREQFARAAAFEPGDSAETRRGKISGLMESHGVGEPLAHDIIADLLGITLTDHSLVNAVTPDRRRALTLETLLKMMDGMAKTQPAVFIIEDIHWADPTTLELLERVIRLAAERPWLILATARPEFEARWGDYADLTPIRLDRLGHDDVEQICVNLGAETALSTKVIDQIIARSDGNPLFVEEITRSVLDQIAAAPATDSGASLVIPATLRDSLAARLDRLGSARRIVNLGAVIGRRFSYELLAAIAALDPREVRQSLRELVKSGLVERTGLPPNSHYVFKHALIRDAAYEALLRREREGLHGRIAVALREQFPETAQAQPALLAYHLTQGGAGAEAIPLWVDAGQRAAARAAHAEAVSHLQTALDIVRRLPVDGERMGLELQLLIGLAVSLAASRGYSVPEVGKVLTEARAICDALGNVAGLFAVLRGICNFSIIDGNRDRAEETARQCLKIAEETGEIEHLIEAHCPLGYALWMKGDFAAARLHLDRAVSLYRQHDGARLAFPTPQDPLIVCLSVLPLLLDALGDDAGARRAADDLVAHGKALGLAFELANAYTWHAWYDVFSERYALAAEYSQIAIDICQEHSYPTYEVTACVPHFAANGRISNTRDAIVFAENLMRKIDNIGILHLTGSALGEMAALQSLDGNHQAALSSVELGLRRTVASGDLQMLSPLHRRRGEILEAHFGRGCDDAVAAYKEALAIGEDQRAPGLVEKARARLAAAAAGA